MDLSTTYLGFKLPHPLIAGASPLGGNLDTVRQLEDAGAAAIVMPSLFEEQIIREQLATADYMDSPSESFAEAITYFPNPEEFRLGPQTYIEQIRRTKAAVKIPVISSLNGSTPGGWLEYAKLMQDAGADALELNLYALAADPKETCEMVEHRSLEIVREVKNAVTIPVAVKLSPYYSCLANMAQKLDEIGVAGLVLFNRFYQPDIDVENLEVERSLELSNSYDLRLRLRWLAVLSEKIKASLAATGGVHTAVDAIKAVMTGAHAVQMVSALLQNGPSYLRTVHDVMVAWMESHEYESLRQMQGSMNLTRCPDPKAYERANYMRVLLDWRPKKY